MLFALLRAFEVIMINYKTYQQKFVSDLINDKTTSTPTIEGAMNSNTNTNPDLAALLNSVPYYQDSAFQSVFRDALTNVIACSLPNDGIAAQPDDDGSFSRTTYSYNGNYSGYQNAFFGSPDSTLATLLISQASTISGLYNSNWWSGYAVALLSDAIRIAGAAGINQGALSNNITYYSGQFGALLSPSYLVVLKNAYMPMVTALNTINQHGDQADVLQALTNAITENAFITNMNLVMATPGDEADAAVWFIFNIWVLLTILGDSNVDQTIGSVITAGLTNLPSTVQQQSWWNGAYTSWYLPLSGADIQSSTITESMPETSVTYTVDADPPDSYSYPNVGNGYSASLCNWGPLNTYNPPPSSCFGEKTQVLMADKTLKFICDINTGDKIFSSKGSRQVVLIENPVRGERVLYQLNRQQVFATSAHPFIAGPEEMAARLAVDPWLTLDGIPTMAAAGVKTLRTGSQLSGLVHGEAQHIHVTELDYCQDYRKDEKVYDLLLDKWEHDHPSYFVGGPDQFFAVEAETTDATHNRLGAAAVITALEMAVETCRNRISNPVAQLPMVLSNISLEKMLGTALRGQKNLERNGLLKISIPGPELYKHNGDWDSHASFLEHMIVKKYGRKLRSLAAAYWRIMSNETSCDHRLVVDIHDIELIGDHPLPDDKQINVKLAIGDAQDTISMSLNKQDCSVYNIHIDQSLYFDYPDPDHYTPALMGKISCGEVDAFYFRKSLHDGSANGVISDYLLFNQKNEVCGRIAITLRTLPHSRVDNERGLYSERSKHHALLMAVSLGRQLGHRIVSELDSWGKG